MWKHVLGALPLMKSGSALQLLVKLSNAVREIVDDSACKICHLDDARVVKLRLGCAVVLGRRP